ncbi:MAG: alpha/beta fold hydrolase [Chlamydiota bacterium]
MKIYFNQPAFDGQLLRVISHTFNGCADIGECLSTATQIEEGNYQSWYEEWVRTADRLVKIAKDSEEKGHTVSARETYLRASNYYRTSLFFHYQLPLLPEVKETYRQHVLTFDKAMSLYSDNFRKVHIPFENISMPGYFYKCQTSDGPRPVIIVNGGYDGTHQEGYYSIIPMMLQRGFHALTFDGPGQGSLLFEDRLPMRYDWETVVTPIVNYLEQLPEVKSSQIILYGASWGGMLAPRAAAFEDRIAALITNPGQWDVMTNFKQAFVPEDENTIGDPQQVENFLQEALKDKHFVRKIHAKMFVHGIDSPSQLLEEWQNYHLSDVVDKILCPTLVCDAENEPFSTGQAKIFYDSLSCPKQYHLFTSSYGAGEHCCAGAIGALSQVIFDWLEETLEPAHTVGV